jgi:4-alpha-glucanotransferase
MPAVDVRRRPPFRPASRHGARRFRVEFCEKDAARPRVAQEPWWDLIALTFSSGARVAMVQAQDVLGLGSEARMNQPGRAAGAWKWRLDELPSRSLARRLRGVARAAGRV